MSEQNNLTFLANIADIPADSGFQVKIPGRPPVGIFKLDDEFFAIDDTCTHGNFSLSEGLIFDGQVECSLHAGAFDIRSGEATDLPCVIPLKTYPVTVKDGKIYADLGEAESPA